jgi:hypothetical protein
MSDLDYIDPTRSVHELPAPRCYWSRRNWAMQEMLKLSEPDRPTPVRRVLRAIRLAVAGGAA